MTKKKEVVEEVKEVVQEPKKEEETKETSKVVKKEKWKKFWSELKSFLIIIIIIGLVVLGGWYWYTHMKDHTKEESKQKEEQKEVVGYDYKVIERDKKIEYCEGCNGKYLVYDSSNNVLSKIYETNGKLLYEGEFEYNFVYEGLDHTLYILEDDLAEEENVISVNRLKDGEIEHLFKVSKENVMFKPILYQDDEDDYYLLGFVGELTSNETGKTVIDKTFIVNLDNETNELDGYSLAGDKANIGVNDPIVTHNKSLITFTDAELKEYGVYDLSNNTVKINAEYELLYSTYDDSFIAKKDGKTGLINSSEKILVVFEYDFIDKNKDFYVIGKDDKLAIMNDKYEFVTGFDFKYQRAYDKHDYNYTLCCSSFNSFAAWHVKDKYLLITNYGSLSIQDSRYDVNEAYIISSDGTYETVAEDYFDQVDGYYLFFNSKDQKYKVYDDSLEEKYTLDLSTYTYGKKPQYFFRIGNVLGVMDKDLYFNIETGKEILKDVTFDMKNVSVKVEKSTIHLMVSEEEVYSFKNDDKFASWFEETDYGYLIQGPKNGKDILLIEK